MNSPQGIHVVTDRRLALENVAAFLQCVQPFIKSIQPRLCGDDQIICSSLCDFAEMSLGKLFEQFPELGELLNLWEGNRQ
jgi:hypothetical protein